MGSLSRWLDDRTGFRRFALRLLDGEAEPNGAWLRTTGFTCLVLVLVECVTGAALGVYYTPSPSSAYKDVVAIDHNAMGRFLRGLHHWTSAALILLAGFTVLRRFFGAEYRGRRDLVWIVSLIFANLVLLFQLTGHILPWDTNAAATAGVEAGIGGNVWVMGPYIRHFLLNGGAVGGATLVRWYGFHTIIIPALLVLLVGLPLLLHRLRGNPGQAEETLGHDDSGSRIQPSTFNHQPSTPYYPWHAAREMVVALLVFLALAVAATVVRTPLELEATGANLAGYQALSEWYVLPLHALTTIPPFTDVRWEPIATVVLPGIAMTLLVLLPFLDRRPSRTPPRPAVAVGILAICTIGALYAMIFVRERPLASEQLKRIAIAQGTLAPTVNLSHVARGKVLFASQGCDGCHAIGGKGGNSGPDLTHEGLAHTDLDWQVAHLVKPTAKVPGSTMPAYGNLKPDELKALGEYLLTLR